MAATVERRGVIHDTPPTAVHPPGVLVSLVSGAAAGALAKTVIAPLDRTKIIFQVSSQPYSWRAAWLFMSSTARQHGARALWRGNSATLARIAPYAAVQFASHEQWKKLLGVTSRDDAKGNPGRLAAAGALAGVTSQSATYPLDAARATLAARGGTLRGRLRAPLAKLYRGYLATVLGVIPYAGVSFFTYDTLKRLYYERHGEAARGLWPLLMGGVAGALGQTASYPLDIVRRRLQVCEKGPDGEYEYRGIRDTLRKIYSTEGARGLVKGLSMNWVKGPLAVGISFATYDWIKVMLGDLSRQLH